MDSDAGQVSNSVEKKLADVFLVGSDRSEHKGLMGEGGRRKEENLYEASSLSRKS